ncbi:MAG: thiamine pyrophosphate-dependent enzyme [Woeseiaceae bacterium]|nr:thiamine pyrophosphate-dependent enzyme [Woeseiaceae bacterium]
MRTREAHDLSLDLVRVLDDDHKARGPWNPDIDASELQVALRWMLLTRIFDERMLQIQRQGRVSFYIQSLGEEAISIAQGMALRPDDMCFPHYRNQGLFLYRGTRLIELFDVPVPVQHAGHVQGPADADHVPQSQCQHVRSIFRQPRHPVPARGRLGDGSRDQGRGQHRGGMDRRRQHGGSRLSPCHHVRRVPARCFNVVNEAVGDSALPGCAAATPAVSRRAASSRRPGVRVDGNDLLAVYAVTDWAAERARRGGGPTIIEHVTYRGGAHSTSDDPSKYRPKDEWAAFPLGDPLERLKQHLITEGHWSDKDHEKLTEELRAEVTGAWKEAQKYGTMTDGPWLDPATMFDDVYAETPEHLEIQRQQMLALEE